MKRPDLSTLACVNPACQQFRQEDQGNLVIRCLVPIAVRDFYEASVYLHFKADFTPTMKEKTNR